MIGNFIETLRDYTNDFDLVGIIGLFIDVALTIVLFILIYKILRIKIQRKRIIVIMLIIFLIYGILYVFQFNITLTIINFLIFWSFGVLIIVYSQEIKLFVDNAFHSNRNESIFTNEEEKYEVIDILVKTAQYLSKRKIGALMTIEREDNLDNIIEKSIQINGNISVELLTTLFTIGTATHDGAVIIRKNKIMCAGAYLPSTDKYDVPKTLGTRHRAAIGISERYDAVTIVISEETGNVSITSDGIINIDINAEELTETLEQYLLVK